MSSLIAVLPYIQLGVAVLLVITILLQQRGSGLSATFGGDGGNIYRTKRGLEKNIFIASIILGAIFLLLALLNLLLQ
jgi:preprotein translocase subunit SecG